MARAAPIHPLTSFRFFAAILVVFHHSYALFLPSKPFPAFVDQAIAVGFIGVSFFFILSGFILAYNYLGPPDRDEKLAPRKFFIARLARIYPVYLLGLLVHAPFVAAHRFHHDPSAAIALGKLIVSFGANAALVQAWDTRLGGGWNMPGWSLSAEAFFYALFPFVAPIVWRSRFRDRTLFFCFVGASLIVPAVALVLSRGVPPPPGNAIDLGIFPLLRLPEFLLGIVVARMYSRAGKSAPAILDSPAALWIGGVLILSLGILEEARIPHLLLTGLLAPAFALLVLGAARSRGLVRRVLSNRPLMLLGDASYAIYIFHVPLIFWFCYLVCDDMRLSAAPTPFSVDQPLYYSAYLGVLIAVSVLSLRFFEEPARAWIRSLPDRSRRRAADQRSKTQPDGEAPAIERLPD